MFDILAEKKNNEGLLRSRPQEIAIEQKADNLEELFINWLNELLSLSATQEIIFSDFCFTKLTREGLQAKGYGGVMSHYRFKTEIKAATYHELEIKKAGPRWQARVIFDV
jgi:SHS2 domain-containing protein